MSPWHLFSLTGRNGDPSMEALSRYSSNSCCAIPPLYSGLPTLGSPRSCTKLNLRSPQPHPQTESRVRGQVSLNNISLSTCKHPRKATPPQSSPDSHSIPFYLVGVDEAPVPCRRWLPLFKACGDLDLYSLWGQAPHPAKRPFSFMGFPHLGPKTFIYIINWVLLPTTSSEGQRFIITP